MARPRVFYSFHYDADVFRVQLVKNMGTLEGDPPVTAGAWEQVWRKGDAAIQNWIDENMKYRQCVVVLVGAQTASRPWVRYEIIKGWNDGKGVVGIHIHNLKDAPTGRTSAKGPNPFDKIQIQDSSDNLSEYLQCHNPSPLYAYDEIKENLAHWVEQAIAATKVQSR
jgi:MTH538 TIR-like domain (DUF1863)